MNSRYSSEFDRFFFWNVAKIAFLQLLMEWLTWKILAVGWLWVHSMQSSLFLFLFHSICLSPPPFSLSPSLFLIVSLSPLSLCHLLAFFLLCFVIFAVFSQYVPLLRPPHRLLSLISFSLLLFPLSFSLLQNPSAPSFYLLLSPHLNFFLLRPPSSSFSFPLNGEWKWPIRLLSAAFVLFSLSFYRFLLICAVSPLPRWTPFVLINFTYHSFD